MCGIAGIVGVNVNSERYSEVIPRMLGKIKHRGPDANGEAYFSSCALGHVRLSIVDLVNGKQPMYDDSGNNCIVFNGEIYGYRDIKKQLAYPFKTNSDTEVLIALYKKYRENMMEYVPGMFAFAIWDEAHKSLFCARDRFGEKPFFYAIGKGGEFVFASEIKAIISTGLIDPVIDYDQLNHFLSYSYIYPTKTIYKNIFTLPPAHFLKLSNGELQVKRYFSLPPTQESLCEEEAIERFSYLFKQAVKRQLVADVPVGAFLSGGLDSGTVVALAADLVPKLTTVSFGFKGGVNELSIARTMAHKYDTNHIELTDIDFDIAELMYTAQNFYDEPMADPASIPAYLISKHAREHVKVVLTGDAGDELLGGYDLKYRALCYAQELTDKNILLREFLLNSFYKVAKGVRRFIQNVGLYSKDPSIRLQEPHYHDIFIWQRAFEWAKEKPSQVVDFMRMKNRSVQQDIIDGLTLYSRECENYLLDDGFLSNENDPDNSLRLDMQEYLPGNGMRKTDRTTMAVGLESRTPFLDIDLAKFCISLPFNLKVNKNKDKYILRRSYSDRWTKEVRNGIKNGFAAPIYLWMRRKSFVNLEEEYLGNRSRKIFYLINYKKLQQIRKERKHLFLIWEFLHLSMWLEMHKCGL